MQCHRDAWMIDVVMRWTEALCANNSRSSMSSTLSKTKCVFSSNTRSSSLFRAAIARKRVELRVLDEKTHFVFERVELIELRELFAHNASVHRITTSIIQASRWHCIRRRVTTRTPVRDP